jgi:hypothetical protein
MDTDSQQTWIAASSSQHVIMENNLSEAWMQIVK